MSNHYPAYPLLPYSQLVYEETRWMPGIYCFPLLSCWRGGAAQKVRIEQAFIRALANHPVFRMEVDWRGRHHDAPLRDIMHGRYHQFTLYTQGEDLYVKALFNRILGDGKSIEILLDDFARAFNGEPLEQDDYWGYVEQVEQHKQSPHYAESRVWLEHEFADTSIPVRPAIDRRWVTTLLPPKAGLYTADYTDLHNSITHLAETHYLSADGLFSLCVALAIADYCGTDAAALTWAYEGRERPEEQRIFGSLHRDIPFQIRKSKIENRESAIKTARNQIRSGIAHSDYPFTLTKPHTNRWNYAVNVLRVPEAEDILSMSSIPIEILPAPPQKYAYALLDVEIHESAGKLQLGFRYSATHYKTKSIEKFAALIRHYAEWLTAEN